VLVRFGRPIGGGAEHHAPLTGPESLAFLLACHDGAKVLEAT